MLSFLEVLESTCSSLGSKAKHLSVKASGNALQAQTHAQRFYQQQHWVVQQCLYPTQAVAKLTANNMEAVAVLVAVEAMCALISMGGLQCHHDHAVQLQMRKSALHCHAAQTCANVKLDVPRAAFHGHTNELKL